ncbi:DNA primase [Nocardiopsis sp. NPDC058631]|uniref:DNA primase n=1 Tax=Nocardiopsis sp. NPDC058631 TaxID=3346566 RepID=UPI0036635269
MKLLDPLLSALSVLRRFLAVGALAAFVVLGTAACDDVLPDVDVEQGDDEDGDEGQDDEGDDDEDGGDDEGDDED